MIEISKLAAAACLLFDAHESLLGTSADALTASVRELADSAMTATRSAVESALIGPGDARQRRDLLTTAIELDGLESPLAALAARRLAEAAEVGALAA